MILQLGSYDLVFKLACLAIVAAGRWRRPAAHGKVAQPSHRQAFDAALQTAALVSSCLGASDHIFRQKGLRMNLRLRLVRHDRGYSGARGSSER